VKSPPVQPPAVRPPKPAGSGSSGGTGTGSGSGSSGGGTGNGGTPADDGSTPPPVEPPVVAPVVAPPPPEGISVAEVTPVRMPARIVAGRRRPSRGRVNVVLKNEGSAAAAGPVTVTLLASADAAASPDVDLTLGRRTRSVRLMPGQTRSFPVRVRFPAPASAGDYLLLAAAAGRAVSTRNVAQLPAPVRIELPAVQLIAAQPAGGAAPLTLTFGGRGALTIDVANAGNIDSKQPLDLDLRVSMDGAFVNSVPLATLTGVRAAIAAGETRPLKLAFALPELPGVAAGSYFLLVALAGTEQVLASVPFTVS
jgi:hypothetical protein